MLRPCSKPLKSALLSAGFFAQFDSQKKLDEVSTDDKLEDLSEGRKRLNAMFSYDEKGSISPQLSFLSSGAFAGFLSGFIIGGLLDGAQTFRNFIEANKATKFSNQTDAKRSLQDKIFLSIFRGGYKLGWRICLFTSTFLGTVLTISTYRGKNTISDYIVGGSVTGAIYKFPQSPKAAISGAVVGALFGTVSGASIRGLLRISGLTLDDIVEVDSERIKEYHELRETRQDEYRKTYERLNIGAIYRKGTTLKTDETIAVSDESAKTPPAETPSKSSSE